MEPAIFFADMRLRSIHRPPRRQTENRTVGACVRASPLFSHRGRRGSASHPRPTDEVRLEPISAPRRKRHVSRFYPARSNEEQGTVREGSPGQMGSRTHHRHSVARTRPRDRGSHRSKGYRSRRAHRQSRVARSISSAKTSDRAETLTWPSPARASVRGGPRVETARVAPYASHLSRATKY